MSWESGGRVFLGVRDHVCSGVCAAMCLELPVAIILRISAVVFSMVRIVRLVS
jgi:hypothetical protein